MPAKTVVFLGDSMTEGVGSRRQSHVTELARLVATQQDIEVIRARRAATTSLGEGLWNWVVHVEPDGILSNPGAAIRFLNLAVEGTTIDYDLELLPHLRAMRPDAIVIFRGVVESIHRIDPGAWPARGLPRRWRALGGMDPRCYFSDDPLRGTKQRVEASIKSRLRRLIIQAHSGEPLMRAETFETRMRQLVDGLRPLDVPIVLCPLLPLGGSEFPGSAAEFHRYNEAIDRIARTTPVRLSDWRQAVAGPDGEADPGLFYLDGLHPNARGNERLASCLLPLLSDVVGPTDRGQA